MTDIPCETNEEVLQEEAAPGLKQKFPTVSLVLGVISILLGLSCSCVCTCWSGAIPMAVSLVGIVLAVLALRQAKKEDRKDKKARAGLILNILGMVLTVVFSVLYTMLGSAIVAAGATTAGALYYFY